MRIPIVRTWTRGRAHEIARRMNACARGVPGAHPNRVYCVERGRFFPLVVKYTEGLQEISQAGGAKR